MVSGVKGFARKVGTRAEHPPQTRRRGAKRRGGVDQRFLNKPASLIELAMAFGLHEQRRRHYGDDIQISVTHGPDRYCRHTRAAVFAVRPATKSRHDR